MSGSFLEPLRGRDGYETNVYGMLEKLVKSRGSGVAEQRTPTHNRKWSVRSGMGLKMGLKPNQEVLTSNRGRLSSESASNDKPIATTRNGVDTFTWADHVLSSP